MMFLPAYLAGCLAALGLAPLGCFIIWQRMAYLSDSLAHSLLLGIALSLYFETNLTVAPFLICSAFAAILMIFRRYSLLPQDTVLGITSQFFLALGLVLLSQISGLQGDITALLFGDILTVTIQDVVLILIVVSFVLGVLVFLWPSFLLMTVDEEFAMTRGKKVIVLHGLLLVLITLVITVAVKIVGVLLLSSLLLIPASAAFRWAKNPEQMAILASVIGVTSVILGMQISLIFDVSAGPAIVLSACSLMGLSYFLFFLVAKRRQTS